MQLMNLSGEMKEVSSVQTTKRKEYTFDTSITPVIASELRSLLDEDYFSPKFQAWDIFQQMYLPTGSDPDLTAEIVEPLHAKIWRFLPRDNPYTPLWVEYRTYCRSSSRNLFEGYHYGWFENTQAICQHYVKNSRQLAKLMYSPLVVNDSIRDLLALNSDIGLMTAIYLCRNCESGFKGIEKAYLLELKARYAKWLEAFKAEYERAGKIIESRKDYYPLFDGVFKDVIFRGWDAIANAIETQDPIIGPIVTAAELNQLQPYVRTHLEFFNQFYPGHACIDYSEDSVIWNLMYEIFCLPNDAKDILYYFHLSCIPKANWNSFVTKCNDFYFEVKNNNFTKGILTRYYNYCCSHEKEQDPAFLEKQRYEILLQYGFPPLKEG